MVNLTSASQSATERCLKHLTGKIKSEFGAMGCVPGSRADRESRRSAATRFGRQVHERACFYLFG